MGTRSTNVVPMDGRAGAAVKSGNRATVLLDACREKLVSHMGRAVPKILDQVDDSLFALAEKSVNNEYQARYFDAMREVRKRRAEMESRFRLSFAELIDEKLARNKDTQPLFQLPDLDDFSLGLVDNEALEESLAVTNMVAKIRTSCKEELFALDKRIGALLNNTNLDAEENPLGPKTYCSAFQAACDELDTDIEFKILILKLFDTHVARGVGSVYTQINEYLISNDVLPTIRAGVRKQHSAHRRVPTSPKGEASATDGVQTREPLAAGNPGYSAQGGVSDTPPTHAQVTSMLHQLMSTGALDPVQFEQMCQTSGNESVLSDLTALQHGAGAQQFGLDAAQLADGSTNVLHQLKTSPAAANLNTVDSIMIDVVAMMFDFILDDKDLPDGVKALVGRLQIPILKVAILDKRFFSNRTHPARKLLNTIAEATAGWSDESDARDALYAKLEQIVHRILEEFNDDIELFAELDAEFAAFLDQEQAQAHVEEEDCASAIEDQEQALLAKRKAHGEVRKRLARSSVIGFVRDFMTGYWQDVLMLTYMQEGESGEFWRTRLDTMDDLLWSLAPKEGPADRARLISLLPHLLGRLKGGMDQTGMPFEEREAFLKKLSGVHVAAISPASNHAPVSATEAREGAGDVATPLDVIEEPVAERDEESLLEQAVKFANQAVFQTAAARAHCKGMGTTVVAARLDAQGLAVAHVGDSRLYRSRAGQLEQLTLDHTLRQSVINKGYYTPEQAAEKVPGHILDRAIGAEEAVSPDLMMHTVESGDLFLFCSDGLSDLVDGDDLQTLLAGEYNTLAALAGTLINCANARGGKDNVSVVLIRAGAQSEERPVCEFAAMTDVGLKRSHNEDFALLDESAGIVVLADGMGGCKAGEVASHMAANIIMNVMRQGSVATVREPYQQEAETQSDQNPPLLVTKLYTDFSDVADEPEGGDPPLLLDDQADSTDQDLGPLFGADVSGAFEEIEITATGEATRAQEDEYTRLVSEFEIGIWVEFEAPDGARSRARLSWVSPLTGTYLFTDRRGAKVADPSRHGLASEFRRGSARLLQRASLVDRITSRLSSKLRDSTVNEKVRTDIGASQAAS